MQLNPYSKKATEQLHTANNLSREMSPELKHRQLTTLTAMQKKLGRNAIPDYAFKNTALEEHQSSFMSSHVSFIHSERNHPSNGKSDEILDCTAGMEEAYNFDD